jgi:hypothetical protein
MLSCLLHVEIFVWRKQLGYRARGESNGTVLIVKEKRVVVGERVAYLGNICTFWVQPLFSLPLDGAHTCSLRAALHLEARPIPLEADCMKFQPFLGWRPASTTHYNKIITGANLSICKGLRVKKLGRFDKSSIIQRI